MNLFTPNANYNKQWSGSVAIVSPSHTPTVDFYITSRLGCLESSAIFRFASLDVDSTATTLPVGTFIVIVRHTSAAWINFIEAHKTQWSGVAYLMDDDIPGAMCCRDIPVDYALWTAMRYYNIRKGLARICDHVWLSTEALRARYPHVNSQLVPPQYFGTIRPAAPSGVKRWGYHGTRAHKQEIKWLLPIVSAVQNNVPEAEFEIFGGPSIERQFHGVPRVHVIPPMPWVEYLQYCDSVNLAVSLAPMLPGKFNVARSYTKAFDIARCGAVGIFSISEPYAELDEHLEGVVLPNNPRLWVEEVMNLLHNNDVRLIKYKQLTSWIERVSTEKSISSIIFRTTQD